MRVMPVMYEKPLGMCVGVFRVNLQECLPVVEISFPMSPHGRTRWTGWCACCRCRQMSSCTGKPYPRWHCHVSTQWTGVCSVEIIPHFSGFLAPLCRLGAQSIFGVSCAGVFINNRNHKRLAIGLGVLF